MHGKLRRLPIEFAGLYLLLIKNRTQLALAIPGAGTSPALSQQLEGIRELASQAIAEVRQISHDLRPYQLDQLGLTRALKAMIESAAASSGIVLTHKLEDVDDVFDLDKATNLYRVMQECVNNIVKHSGASAASLRVERDVREVLLAIEDNGRGFDPAQIARTGAAGFGLKNLAERARILDATFRIITEPGQGTRIEVVVPIPLEV